MSKVLLVEDDQNLREIFSMRLQAEGYQTITAGDGEEALTVAVKEKPDLIIADVMMPRLSGFEMLETLRSAPDMADTKVIMMTALGQAEDQARGEKLGVIKYLVKSQVTLEDFVRVVHDVLQPAEATNPGQNSSINNQGSENTMPDDSSTPTNPAAMPDDSAAPAMPAAPADSNPISDAPAMPAEPADNGGQMSTAQEQTTVDNQINDFAASAPAAPAMPASEPAPSDSAVPADGTSVPVMPPPATDPMAAPATPEATETSMPADSTSGGL